MQFRKNSGLRRLLAASVSVLMLTGTLPGIFNDFVNVPIAAQAEETASIDFANGPVIVTTTGYKQGGVSVEYTGDYVFKGDIAAANPLTFVNDTNKPVEFNVTFDGDVNIVAANINGAAVTIKGNKMTTVNVRNNGNASILNAPMIGEYEVDTFLSEVNSVVSFTNASGKSVDFGESPSAVKTKVLVDGMEPFVSENFVNITNRYFFFFQDLIQGVYVDDEQISVTGGFMPSSYSVPWEAEVTVITRGQAKFNGVALDPVEVDDVTYTYEFAADEDFYVEPALTLHIVQPATCDKEGMDYYFSSDDNKYYRDYTGQEPIEDLSTLVIPKTDHNIVPTPTTDFMGQAANEKENYYKCTICGRYFSDAEGTNEVDASEVVIEAVEHDHEYDDNGFCKDCGGYQPAEEVNGVWQISNAGQLYWFAQQCDSGNQKNAVLTKDIVIQKIEFGEDNLPTNLDELRTWKPITMYSTVNDSRRMYSKTFDGCGHTISGLYVEVGDTSNSNNQDHGLFGCTSGAEIKNLGMLNSYIVNGYYDCGSFVGDACYDDYGSTVLTNCYSFAVIDCNGRNYCGGLIGYGDDSSDGTAFENCYFAGKMVNGNQYAICDDYGTARNTWYLDDCGGRDYDDAESFTAEDLASGKLAYELNKNADALTYYQMLGEDAYPHLDSTKGIVHRVNGDSGDIDEFTNDHVLVKIEQRDYSPALYLDNYLISSEVPGVSQDVWYDDVCHKYYTDEQATTEIDENDVFVYPDSTVSVNVVSKSVTDLTVNGWTKDSEDGSVTVFKGSTKNVTAAITSTAPIAVWACVENEPAPDPVPGEEPVSNLQRVAFVEATMTSDGVYTAELERGMIYEIADLFEIDNEGTITAYNGPCNVLEYNELHVNGYSGDTIVIPEKINDITVKAIGKEVFKFAQIKSITFPSTLEEIGDGAFYGASFDENDLDLSNTSVRTIGIRAFESYYYMLDHEVTGSCLESVTFPETLEYIGVSAFYGNRFTELTIPKSVQYIALEAFAQNPVSSLIFETEEDGTSELKAIESSAFSIGFISNNQYPDGVIPIGQTMMVRDVTITVPACRIDGYAFSGMIMGRDMYLGRLGYNLPTSLRIVVTPNGDRQLDLGKTDIAAYNVVSMPDGVFDENDLYTGFETMDLPTKSSLGMSQQSNNMYMGNDDSLSIQSAQLFVEDNVPIADLGAYA